MTTIERPASDFKELCAMLGYRRKKVDVRPCLSVTLYCLNWSGGTRYTYSAVDLLTMTAYTPNLGAPHPLLNENEGARIAMRPGVLIVQTGFFCGKVGLMTINVHPDNMPAMIGAEHANV